MTFSFKLRCVMDELLRDPVCHVTSLQRAGVKEGFVSSQNRGK